MLLNVINILFSQNKQLQYTHSKHLMFLQRLFLPANFRFLTRFPFLSILKQVVTHPTQPP